MADFPQRASQAGVDGLIMVVPLEEGATAASTEAVNIDVVWSGSHHPMSGRGTSPLMPAGFSIMCH